MEFLTLMQPDTPEPTAWHIPALGQVASEALPQWLVGKLMRGEILINGLGGFTPRGEEITKACVAGDVVRLMADDTLVFERPEDAAVH